jgi:adenylate cyclase
MKRRRQGTAATSRTTRARRLLLAAVALTAIAVGLTVNATGVLRSLELSTVDARFSIRGTQKPPPDIVFVAVSDQTFTALGTPWPFCYKVHGQLIDDIAAASPKAIAYDILVPDPAHAGCGGQKDSIAFLNDVLNANGKVVLQLKARNSSLVGFPSGEKALAEIDAAPGEYQFPGDPAAITRRLPYSLDGVQSFAVATAQTATGHRVPASIFGGQPAWIDYAGPAGTFPTVDFSQVLQRKLPPHFFRGKIVVVGASASSLDDLHATPTASLMPGSEIQANAIATVLRGLPLRSAPTWLGIVIILILGGAVPLAGLRIGALPAIGLGAVMGTALLVAAQLAFDGGLIVGLVSPLIALAIATVGSLGVHLVVGAFERERVRDLFARFVPEDVVGEVLARSGGLRLGGVQIVATVMFTDLRGFTSFAESLTPDRVIEVLNRYLSEMSESILDHGGTLVSYMGDGIFAVFGAPIESPDHADRALATARDMLQTRLPRFNAWLHDAGLSDGFRMGIGLNTGPVMSGNVGSERRVEYAAVGDATNSASRIESLTKGTPYQLFLSGTTRDALVAPPDDLLFVREEQLRGRVGTVTIWSLGGDPAAADAVGAGGQETTDGDPAGEVPQAARSDASAAAARVPSAEIARDAPA